MIRPVICDWDASSTHPGTSPNSSGWRDLLTDLQRDGYEFLEPLYLNRRLGELLPSLLEATTRAVIRRGEMPLTLGGDHRITHSVVKAMQHYVPRPFTIHQFDAHHDAHPSRTLNNYSFMHFLRDKHGCDIVRHGCREPLPAGLPAGERAPGNLGSYVTIDVDYLDPELFESVTFPLAVPPGTACSVETLIDELNQIAAAGPLVGCDVVEWRASDSTTTDTKSMRSILGHVLSLLRTQESPTAAGVGREDR